MNLIKLIGALVIVILMVTTILDYFEITSIITSFVLSFVISFVLSFIILKILNFNFDLL